MNPIAAVEHPLTIAEVFDRAVVLCVRRWQVVVALSALDAAPGVITRAANRGRVPVDDGAFYSMMAAEVLVSSVAFAALVRTFGEAGSSTRMLSSLGAAVRDFPRSAGAYLVFFVGVVLISALTGGLAFVAFGLGSRAGGPAGAIVASLAVGVPVLLLVAPLLTVVVVAYPTTILERRGPLRGLVVAGKRVLSGDLRRGGLLGVAWLIGSVALPFAAEPVVRQIAALTGQPLTGVFQPLLDSLFGPFGTAVGFVTAVDYRNRREGTDLQAALEQAPA